nr:hypothetical protein CFP56_60210 [Quercus suber]
MSNTRCRKCRARILLAAIHTSARTRIQIAVPCLLKPIDLATTYNTSRLEHSRHPPTHRNMDSTPESQTRKKTWLIVGASRGIGHGFVRQLLQNGDQVYATVRNPSRDHDLSFWMKNEEAIVPSSGNLHVFDCDMLSEQSINGSFPPLFTFVLAIEHHRLTIRDL